MGGGRGRGRKKNVCTFRRSQFTSKKSSRRSCLLPPHQNGMPPTVALNIEPFIPTSRYMESSRAPPGAAVADRGFCKVPSRNEQVRLKDLKSAQDMNREIGIVLQHVGAQDRYQVKLTSQEQKGTLTMPISLFIS